MIKAIIFDMDGTIVDTEPVQFEAFKEIVAEIDIELTKERFKSMMGVSTKQNMINLLKENNLDTEPFVEELVNKKEIIYLEKVKDKIKPKSCAVEKIKELKQQGYKIAIASSSIMQEINLISKSLNIRKFIDAYVGGDSMEKSKPAPDIFLKAAELMNVKPNECIVIEDSSTGYEAALNADMKCIVVPSTVFKQSNFKKAFKVLDTLCELNMEMIQDVN